MFLYLPESHLLHNIFTRSYSLECSLKSLAKAHFTACLLCCSSYIVMYSLDFISLYHIYLLFLWIIFIINHPPLWCEHVFSCCLTEIYCFLNSVKGITRITVKTTFTPPLSSYGHQALLHSRIYFQYDDSRKSKKMNLRLFNSTFSVTFICM